MLFFVFKDCGNVFIEGLIFVIMRLSEIWAVGISVIGIGIIVFILFNIVFVSENEVEKCIEVNKAAGFVYDVCYDSISNNIFMLVRGGMKGYKFDSFSVAFVDSQFRRYELIYKEVDASQLYKFAADKNPGYVNLTVNVIGEFEFPICEAPRKLVIKDCLTKLPGWGEGSLNGTVIEDYVPIEGPTQYNISDFVDFEKEEAWRSVCEPDWECFEWEECIGGVQRQRCIDKNNCFISLDVPRTVRFCEEQCVESWVCNWSECVDGFTTPTCFDENNCGTFYLLPPKMSCVFEEECLPRIRCEKWSSCDVDYDLLDLLENNVSNLKGVKSRVCYDLNACVEPLEETKECGIGVDVYMKRFEKCGKEFVGIYDVLDNSLIARIDEGTDEDPYLNIYLDEGEEEDIVCEHCFNGIQDEDEEGVDCGGSCGPCLEEVVDIRKGFWERVSDFFG